MKNLENISENDGENLERKRTDWPSTLVLYSTLIPYGYGFYKLLDEMYQQTPITKTDEMFLPAIMIGGVTGVFVLRGIVGATVDLARKLVYSKRK